MRGPWILVAALTVGALVVGCGAGIAPARRNWHPQTPSPAGGERPNHNGVLTLDAPEIVRQAVAATVSAPSLRLKGEVRDGDHTYVLNLRFDSRGGGGRIEDDERVIEVLRVGNNVWFRGDIRFWREVAGWGDAEDYEGSYLEVPTSEPRYAGLVGKTRLSSLLDDLMRGEDEFIKGRVARVGDRRALGLVSQHERYGGTVWVALDGPPYVLRVEAGRESRIDGVVDLYGFGERFDLEPPEPERVVEPADLG